MLRLERLVKFLLLPIDSFTNKSVFVGGCQSIALLFCILIFCATAETLHARHWEQNYYVFVSTKLLNDFYIVQNDKTHQTISFRLQRLKRWFYDMWVSVCIAIGFNVETITCRNLKFQVWDLGGQTSIRYGSCGADCCCAAIRAVKSVCSASAPDWLK